MSIELGKAYVQVIPSTRDIKGLLTNELTGATSSAASTSGKGFAAGFGKAAIKTFGAVGLATTMGEVFTKGFSRMTAIDEAKAKLTALGHSTESVAQIAENANKAVKGTAYGMDTAMTAAASATAAGIAPGKELTKYLTLMGDAAAVAGIDMGEMGSIFNKVAANGKITTEEMNQLADRGIPIWQLLSKTTGTSMDEMRDAVTAGKFDIQDLQNAIESGMGGAAKTIGSTTITGAISNIGASISRIGANLLGSADNADSFAGKLLPLMNNLMGFMGKIETGASVIGQVLGSILGPVMDGVGKIFNEVGKGAGTLGPLKAMLIQVSSVLGRLISALIPVIVRQIRLIFKVLGPILSIVGKVVSTVISSVNKIINKVTSAKNKIQSIVKKIKAIFDKLKLKLDLKIPHISLSGGKAPWGIAGKGRLPSFKVRWAAQGGIVDGATLIGAGEKGREAIVPLDQFWNRLEKSGIDYDRLGAVLINVLSRTDRTINTVIDGKVAAKATAPYMRKEITTLDTRANRSLGYVGV